MGNAEEILVIILSTTLAIFLILAIIATTKVIKILDDLKAISEKAEKLATTAESVGEFFKYTAGPAALTKFIGNITDTVMKNRKKGDS